MPSKTSATIKRRTIKIVTDVTFDRNSRTIRVTKQELVFENGVLTKAGDKYPATQIKLSDLAV
jgi:hypothetical protein